LHNEGNNISYDKNTGDSCWSNGAQIFSSNVLDDFAQQAVDRNSVKDRSEENKETLDNVIIHAVQVMDASETADISNDLEDSAKDEGDKEFLAIFDDLENVP